LLAVITWIGGGIFNLFAFSPYLPSIELKQRAILVRRVFTRFLTLAWGSIFIIAVSGLYRVFFVNNMITAEPFLNTTYGNALLVKLSLVSMMITIVATITFVLFPKISEHLKGHETETVSPKMCPICGKMLKQVRQLMTAGLGLAVIVVFLAAFLRGA
jgi:putative copper export protein